ncbi:MAG: hypothetical protein ACYDB7_07195 [Mycobacteriales bacterium]
MGRSAMESGPRRRLGRGWNDVSLRTKALVVVAVPRLGVFVASGLSLYVAHADQQAGPG